VAANAESIRASAEALKTLPRPTIARIEGSCFGGGALLALACDFRIADTTASFAITPARLGLVYSIGDTSNLVNTVGLAVARRMLMLSEVLDAEAAILKLVWNKSVMDRPKMTQNLLLALPKHSLVKIWQREWMRFYLADNLVFHSSSRLNK